MRYIWVHFENKGIGKLIFSKVTDSNEFQTNLNNSFKQNNNPNLKAFLEQQQSFIKRFDGDFLSLLLITNYHHFFFYL